MASARYQQSSRDFYTMTRSRPTLLGTSPGGWGASSQGSSAMSRGGNPLPSRSGTHGASRGGNPDDYPRNSQAKYPATNQSSSSYGGVGSSSALGYKEPDAMYSSTSYSGARPGPLASSSGADRKGWEATGAADVGSWADREEKLRKLEELSRRERELHDRERALKEELRRKEEARNRNELRRREEEKLEELRRREEELKWREEERQLRIREKELELREKEERLKRMERDIEHEEQKRRNEELNRQQRRRQSRSPPPRSGRRSSDNPDTIHSSWSDPSGGGQKPVPLMSLMTMSINQQARINGHHQRNRSGLLAHPEPGRIVRSHGGGSGGAGVTDLRGGPVSRVTHLSRRDSERRRTATRDTSGLLPRPPPQNRARRAEPSAAQGARPRKNVDIKSRLGSNARSVRQRLGVGARNTANRIGHIAVTVDSNSSKRKVNNVGINSIPKKKLKTQTPEEEREEIMERERKLKERLLKEEGEKRKVGEQGPTKSAKKTGGEGNKAASYKNLVARLALKLKELPPAPVQPNEKTAEEKRAIKTKFEKKFESLPPRLVVLALQNVAFEEDRALNLLNRVVAKDSKTPAEFIDLADDDQLDFEAED